MATSKSIRRAPVRARQMPLGRSASARSRRRRENGSPTASPSLRLEDWRRLTGVVPRLRAIYGIAITAERALRQQGGEQDPEIADCLRAGVCDPLADQIRTLQGISQHRKDREPPTEFSLTADPVAPERFATRLSESNG